MAYITDTGGFGNKAPEGSMLLGSTRPMNPDNLTQDGSNILGGIFDLVNQGASAYTNVQAALDQRSNTPAQTSVAPTNTATNPAGAVAVSPQTLAIVIAAVVAVGAVIVMSRK